MDAELEQILDDHYLDGHSDLAVEDLRAMRTRCQRAETSLSYLRRLAQGRVDIVAAELERRAGGGDPADLDDLVERLATVLSEKTESTHVGPMPRYLVPGRVEGELADELAAMELDAHLLVLQDVSTEWLTATRERLIEFEGRISELRRALFVRIDTLGEDLAQRYRDGEADIDAIIGDAGAD